MTFPLQSGLWIPGVVTYTPAPPGPQRIGVLAQFTGRGTLAGALTNIDVAFAGEGTLTATVTSVYPEFSSEGTLQAAAYVGLLNVDAEFGGSGALAASVAT